VPIRPPALDDRSFDDLVAEVIARIPAHTPEWTNASAGDPGRTLIELFCWLTDTLLYRVNLIPERQRLAFLQLLGEQMNPATPATGLITIGFEDKQIASPQIIQRRALVTGPANFETRSEMTVLPISGEAYYKRKLTDDEQGAITTLLPGLAQVYGITGQPVPYATTPVFVAGVPDPKGFDITSSIDQTLWIALLAPKELVAAVRASIGAQLLSVGFVPSTEVAALFEDIGPRASVPHTWQITTGSVQPGVPDYVTLDIIQDSTGGLRKPGVERLLLPRSELIGAPNNDVRQNLTAGVGKDRPPRIDDAEKAAQLVAWLRLRSTIRMERLSATWVGTNAVFVEQRQTIFGRVIGQSDGTADQLFSLPGQSVESESLVLQVEETGLGFVNWTSVDDLSSSNRDDRVFSLDREAGTVRFGDGLRGRIPEATRRIRVAVMRAGGGATGNLPPGALTSVTAVDGSGKAVVPKLKVAQTMATQGGQDAETLQQAERRIPALFRNRDRAVTQEDYQRLASQTPAVSIGRVEVLARFKPQQRKSDVPGVISVMVLPKKTPVGAPNPRPDRPTLEAVHAYISDRKPVATELYVIGCEYIPVSVSAGVTLLDGFGPETVHTEVRDAVRQFLWPLAGGGTDQKGWRLGRSVREREIDVAVARVPGVDSLNGVNLFNQKDGTWQLVGHPGEIALELWQLPELMHVTVADGDPPASVVEPASAETGVAVPVVPDVC
jgi:predicted phage baseplate assembly protein